MFDSSSRYYALDNATLASTDAQGKQRLLVYKRRRFIPTDDTATLLVEHTVSDGERLDNITTRYMNDPTQYWRICDTNGAVRPTELTAQVGRVLRIVTSLS